MITRKKYLLLTIFLITIIQILIYINNYQKTSFRYFKWTFQEVSIGKLISISFLSGLLISTFLNKTISSHTKNTYEDIEEDYETLKDYEDMKSNVEMPPQRNIRDAQPTISVNYRVVKNKEENNPKRDPNYSNYSDKNDDWNDDDDDW